MDSVAAFHAAYRQWPFRPMCCPSFLILEGLKVGHSGHSGHSHFLKRQLID